MKIKHAYLFIAGIFMCLSCSQAEQDEKKIAPDGQKQLTSVRVNMDFSYSQIPLDEEENSTRATATAAGAGVNRIAFTVYDQENAVVYADGAVKDEFRTAMATPKVTVYQLYTGKCPYTVQKNVKLHKVGALIIVYFIVKRSVTL